METMQQQDYQMLNEQAMALSPITVNKENGVIWQSSCTIWNCHRSHSIIQTASIFVSDSGSDIFSKREVIQKLWQLLKRRDDRILEMQDQIGEHQNSLGTQLSHCTHLQSLLDAANRYLFDFEREIQMFRKAITDHCVRKVDATGKPPTVGMWPTEGRNVQTKGVFIEQFGLFRERKRSLGRIELLTRNVSELREVIEGNEYLVQSFC